MRRNWHGDEITLVLFSELKECKPTDPVYMQMRADALMHITLQFNIVLSPYTAS